MYTYSCCLIICVVLVHQLHINWCKISSCVKNIIYRQFDKCVCRHEQTETVEMELKPRLFIMVINASHSQFKLPYLIHVLWFIIMFKQSVLLWKIANKMLSVILMLMLSLNSSLTKSVPVQQYILCRLLYIHHVHKKEAISFFAITCSRISIAFGWQLVAVVINAKQCVETIHFTWCVCNATVWYGMVWYSRV